MPIGSPSPFVPGRPRRARFAPGRITRALACALLLAATLVQGARLHVAHASAPLPAHTAVHDTIAAGTDGIADGQERRTSHEADALLSVHCPLCAPLPSAVAVPPRSPAEIRDTLDVRRAGRAPEPARRPPRA